MSRSAGIILTFALLLASGAAPAAPVPPVAEPDVCLECHADVAGSLQAAHLHTVFGSGECSACHNPHASRHAALLDSDPRRLCFGCHGEIEAETARAFPHEPALSGGCSDCHDPHAGEHRNQLRRDTPDLCFACHPAAAAWPQRTVVHAPVAAGDCFDCHAAHGAENEFLTTEPVPRGCFGCHERDRAFGAAHGGRDLGEADCIACHDPHASNRDGLLRANRHAPFAGGDCSTCHGDPAPEAGFAIAGDTREICLRCHRGVETEMRAEGGIHLASANSCTDCHNPHAADGEALLAARQTNLCMRCHFDHDPRRGKSFYVTHDGMDCTECHEPHGNDRPIMLTGNEVDLCARCHESAHRVSHPVGPEVIDPRTGEPVTCLSCHRLHGAEFEPYLPLDPAMDLCVVCHKK